MIQLSYKIYIPLPMYPWISWLKNRRMKCKAGRKSKIISYKVTDTCFQRNNFVKSGNLFRKPLFVNIIIQGTLYIHVVCNAKSQWMLYFCVFWNCQATWAFERKNLGLFSYYLINFLWNLSYLSTSKNLGYVLYEYLGLLRLIFWTNKLDNAYKYII